MSSTTFILIGVTYYIISVIIIILVLNLINRHDKKKYKESINNLERDKNLIINANILSELNKVESLINNEELIKMYDDWKKRFKIIKEEELPKINDDLIKIEDLFQSKKYKELNDKMASVELEIYEVKSKADRLLNEIRNITLSEEKNRDIITKLKSRYREVIKKYNNGKDDYVDIKNTLELQFENVDKLFAAFEIAMDNNSYTEVPKIVKAIDDLVGNLALVIDEAPSIIMMGKKIIPSKMKDVYVISQKMVKEGYNLDYLNVEYNCKETDKKIQDIFARLKVLNIEDSVLELKTLLDYFDSLYQEFDKERTSRRIFEDYLRTVLVKANKLENINNDLYKRLDAIKFSYDLTDQDVKVIDVIKEELITIKKDYESLVMAHRSKSYAYSRLSKEMDLLNNRLTNVEDKLSVALRNLGSLKEDELRARDQLNEIKDILIKSKNKMNSYKLPNIPQDYYVELSEANLAIKEVIKELEKQPISIKILNLRVDTARDLALKVYNTTNEVIKTAQMVEMAIMYGNRYRPINREVDLGLAKAENLFYKGNYKNALENAIHSISTIEKDFYERLKMSVQS